MFPLWGRYNDRSGRPLAGFAFAALGCGAAIATQALPLGLPGVLALRLLQGACFGALAQSLFFHATRVASERRAGGAVGSANSFLLAGQSLGPLVVGSVTAVRPVPMVITLLGGACIVAGLLALSAARRVPGVETLQSPAVDRGVGRENDPTLPVPLGGTAEVRSRSMAVRADRGRGGLGGRQDRPCLSGST